MKTIFATLAVSLLAVSAAQASSLVPADGATLRNVELTDSRDIRDAGSSSITVTVGAPKEVTAVALPPRDRVEAGYKADQTVTLSVFPAGEVVVDNRR